MMQLLTLECPPIDEPRYERDRSASPRDEPRGDRARSRSPNGRSDDRYAFSPLSPFMGDRVSKSDESKTQTLGDS
jgi:hypothetical protein